MDKENFIIEIYQSSQGGYMYDIFQTRDDLENDNPIDGGHCTGTVENAMEMAIDTIQRIEFKI